MALKYEWYEKGPPQRCPTDSDFPDGIDVEIPGPTDGRRCSATLDDYPTNRTGIYVISCDICPSQIALITAGLPHDPRSVSLPCSFPTDEKGH